MPTRFRFTKASIAALPLPPKGKRTTVYDSEIPKLALRLTHTGSRTYCVPKRVGPKMEWITLGAHPDMTPEQARRAAQKVLGEFAAGENPAQAKREARADIDLGEGFEQYMAGHFTVRKKKTAAATQQLFERCLGAMPNTEKKKHGRQRTKHPKGVNWQHRLMRDIARPDCVKLHNAIGTATPIVANRVIELGSAIFNRIAPASENPFSKIEPFPEAKRERFLQSGELPRFFAALGEDSSEDFRDFITLSLLTGARRTNVLTMAWAHVDFAERIWRIPGEVRSGKQVVGQATKNNEPLAVALVPEAMQILRARLERDPRAVFVFPAASKSGRMTPPKKRWAQLQDRIELRELEKRIHAAGGEFAWINNGTESIERAVVRAREVAAKLDVDTRGARLDDLRLHDLRRSLGSWQARLGASLPIIGKSLGHRSAASTQIYARLDQDPVRASVTAATAAMLEAAGLKKPATIKPLRAVK